MKDSIGRAVLVDRATHGNVEAGLGDIARPGRAAASCDGATALIAGGVDDASHAAAAIMGAGLEAVLRRPAEWQNRSHSGNHALIENFAEPTAVIDVPLGDNDTRH
jgi:hypothetical protein